MTIVTGATAVVSMLELFGYAALGQPLAFDPKIGLLDVETREIVPHPLAGGSGVVDGVAQRRGVADRAEHVAPGGLHIPFEVRPENPRGGGGHG